MRRVPLHRWLAAVPALLILVGVPFANHVHHLVLGIPFLLFWIVACVVLTSPIMALVGVLDTRSGDPADAEPPPTRATDSGPGR